MKEKYNLVSNLPIVFIGGAGQGGGNIYKVCKEISKDLFVIENENYFYFFLLTSDESLFSLRFSPNNILNLLKK